MLGTTGMATKRRKLMPKPPEDAAWETAKKAGLTPERYRKSGGHFDVGDDKEGHKIVTMRDSPLERARTRKAITEAQYNAGVKYRHHHYRAGLAGGLRSSDLDRVFGGFGSGAGLFVAEGASHHWGQYRNARDALKPLHAAVVEAVVCEELPLNKIGQDLGWKSKDKAIAAVEGVLRDALQKLVVLWGL